MTWSDNGTSPAELAKFRRYAGMRLFRVCVVCRAGAGVGGLGPWMIVNAECDDAACEPFIPTATLELVGASVSGDVPNRRMDVKGGNFTSFWSADGFGQVATW